jgi:hypothetical protein
VKSALADLFSKRENVFICITFRNVLGKWNYVLQYFGNFASVNSNISLTIGIANELHTAQSCLRTQELIKHSKTP